MNLIAEVEGIDVLPPSEIEHHKAGSAYIGKDILELLSISMYVDPLAIYREFIQNSTDAIDEARELGLMRGGNNGKIQIYLSQKDRSIIIRDNGCGIQKADFERLMVSFGGSRKRGRQARGFRGVGRFSGLAFCQKLIFRTQAASENTISEIVWDGRKFRELLDDDTGPDALESVVSEVATITTYDAQRKADQFFEVELERVIRTKNDMLLNEDLIERYLGQNAPVPYSEEFLYKSQIEDFLSEHAIQPGYSIYLSSDYDDEKQIFRPYRDSFSVSESVTDSITGIQTFRLESVHDGVSAIGWIYEQDYKGVISPAKNIRGVRVRCGNIQIGDEAILAQSFPEARFNSWSMGEIHVLDQKIVPNGRRDNFEHNVHWLGVQSQFSPYAKSIAKECRRSSSERNIVKTFNSGEERAIHLLSLVNQGVLSKTKLKEQREELALTLLAMRKSTNAPILTDDVRSGLLRRYEEVELRANSLITPKTLDGDFIEELPRSKRRAFQEVFDLVYECSLNKIVAKSLLDKIIETYRAKNIP